MSTRERAWRGLVTAFLAVFFGVLGLVYAAIIMVDPYDTGYFPSVIGPGVVDDNEQTNIASRARSPRFDAAIFGNSHGQLLDPTALSQASGLAFIQLYALGTGPREQMLIMRYFLRRHPGARVIVLAADPAWCTHDPTLPRQVGVTPFPSWLYGEDRLVYLANVLSTRIFPIMGRRIRLALGKLSPTDPVGFSSYETGRVWNFNPAADEPVAAPPPESVDPDTFFPAIDQLEHLAGLSPEISVIIAMPPVYATMLPAAGTPAAAELALCKDRLAQVTARHAGGAFLDFLVDSPLSRDPANFMDPDHMRTGVARLIDERIAAVLMSAKSSGPRAR
jgi:hypothetical protein